MLKVPPFGIKRPSRLVQARLARALKELNLAADFHLKKETSDRDVSDGEKTMGTHEKMHHTVIHLEYPQLYMGYHMDCVYIYIYYYILVGGFNHVEKMLVNGKDYPIYYGK